MTSDYRRICVLPGRTAFQVIGSFLAVTAIVLVWFTALPCAAVYGAEGPSSESQQLRMLRFVSAGPIQIAITDPEGNIVGREANEIDGAIFLDGDREVIIEIPHSIAGDYEVHANVSGSANRLQRFDVSVTDDVTTIVLAERELIANVPRDPYVIRNDHDGFSIAQDLVDDDQEESSSLIWLFAGGIVVIVGAALVVLKLRKRKR